MNRVMLSKHARCSTNLNKTLLTFNFQSKNNVIHIHKKSCDISPVTQLPPLRGKPSNEAYVSEKSKQSQDEC